MLELNCIGVPEVILDGRPITFARRGSIGLLVYLALSGKAHARESLATLLTGDGSEDQARKHLSNVLIDLRQHIGEYVVTDRQTVAFARGRPHRLDVAEFQTDVAQSLATDSPVELQRAIGLYRDEFLSGLSLIGAPDFESWLLAEREELRGQYMLALRAQVESSLRRCAWNSGIAAARRLISEEPWLEEAHRQLMLLLARSGQRQSAIAQYQSCRRVLREELGVEPQPETTALYNRLRAAVTRPPHNLPLTNSPLVGRTEELRLLTALMAEPDCRLTTIAGLGGSGKTRLAVEVGRAYATPSVVPPEQPFADGIAFVPVAELGPPLHSGELLAAEAEGRILAAIDVALELPRSPRSPRSPSTSPRQRVLAHLRSKAMLLVLDNLEQLLSGVGALSELLAQAPELKLLITSRVPLHVSGERVLLLDGLALPADEDDLESAAASALYLHEARRVQLGFELPDAERPHLVELCRAVGGFPLALVLAARWSPVLTCSQVLAELAHGLEVLATTESDLPERQRSVAAVLESTLAGLPSNDRALARSLAVECERIGASDGAVPAALLPRVGTLRDRALLSMDNACGTVRLHPLLQRYVGGSAGPRPAPVRAA
jgi:DNA-binding SARP family transcriptional activator